MRNTSSSIVSDTGLSTEEITRASRHLSVTRGFLLESVTNLSPEQWNFKSAGDAWSIAENVEHIVLIESAIHAIIEGMSEGPEVLPEGNASETEDFIVNEIPKRSTKVKSPARSCPTGRWSGPEALEKFIECREKSNRLLITCRLRGRVFPHPMLGPWDGYQWLLAAASHGARHTAQICEVKAGLSFPSVRLHALHDVDLLAGK